MSSEAQTIKKDVGDEGNIPIVAMLEWGTYMPVTVSIYSWK